MYPYLEPHGLIMKINRQPLTELSDEIVQRDRDYWTKYIAPMVGNWLNSDTSVKEVAAFTEKVYAKKDFNGFQGDRRFIQSSDSQKMFSKERSSIAGLYAWRAQHSKDAAERKRMNDAADFAFRQVIALCPYSPEAVFQYVNLLVSEQRFSDALLVAETAAKMPAMKGRDGNQIRDLVTQLKPTRREFGHFRNTLTRAKRKIARIFLYKYCGLGVYNMNRNQCGNISANIEVMKTAIIPTASSSFVLD